MRASKISPLAWGFGNIGPLGMRRYSLMREWNTIQRNVERMETNLLLLMANPDTTPEQLKQAAEAYANVTKLLHEHAVKVDESIYNEGKPKKEQA